MSLAKQKFLLLLGFALLAATFLSVPAQAQEEESKRSASNTGAISGRVINENGQPIPHAAIYLYAQVALPQPRTTVTDDGGNFQVSGLDALVYFINISAPSYITAPREPDSVPPYYRIGDAVTISMIKGGVITGTVTSATGEPVVQVAVRAALIRDVNGKEPSAGRFANDKVTDDRGVYRFYGLAAGTYVVSAGGRGSYWSPMTAYDTDSPTYAPSSTRDAATEITVRAGEETSSVDIRYRGESGHALSGFASGLSSPNFPPTNITLTQIVNGVRQASFFSFQPHNGKGFAFYGVADGDYDLIAQSTSGEGETVAAEPRRITVKGADITGIELVVKPLASISGQVALETSTAAECKNKRKPLFSETLLVARRNEKSAPRDQPAFPNFSAQTSPDKAGKFVLRNLLPGQRDLSARFFAKYWYLRSIIRENSAPQPLRGALTNPQLDVAQTGLALKFGERVSGVTVTLAEGAASLRGAVKLAAGENVASGLYLHLVPAEKERGDDVLRFFTVAINTDGTFAINNLPPGRYWALTRIADNAPLSDLKLRNSDEAATRTRLRLAAEAVKTEIEFKPCQNVVDYQLPFKNSALKN